MDASVSSTPETLAQAQQVAHDCPHVAKVNQWTGLACMTCIALALTEQAREIERLKEDHAHTLMASSEMESALRARLTEARAERDAVRRATWEAAAKIAELQESPWSTEHPTEAFISRLQEVILPVLLNVPKGDDNEPERSLAVAVFDFLNTGHTALDKLFASESISKTLRARAAALGGTG